jgi:Fe-S oxidoreductase
MSLCPWNAVSDFLVYRIIAESRLGIVDLASDDIWRCATCGLCMSHCPRGVGIIDIMRALRRTVVEMRVGRIPDSLQLTVKDIARVGNPMGEDRERRADWAKGLDVKPFAPGTELLYFSCCMPAYDENVRGVAQAMVTILKKAGVVFGILGVSESCCGESVRKAGSESVFQDLAASNISVFAENGVKNVLVTSPHCYYTFKNEYPEFGGNFNVMHHTQYLWELIREARITFTKELNKKVTYHDPCYLGRHIGIYDEPRQVLKSIPGLELIEMPDSRETSLCCGGGGGRGWMETKKEERFSDRRLEQAIAVGAEILSVACPYCMVMFKDSQLTMENGDAIEIKDISELVLEAL